MDTIAIRTSIPDGIDAPSTRVIMGRVVKVLIRYNNEYGYARRLLELTDYISR